MTATVLVCSILLALAFGALGSAKVAATPAMRDRAAHVRFSVDAYRRIGLAELAAVAGLLVGLVWTPAGVLAAAGLLLLLAGAVVAHLRTGRSPREILPALVLAVVLLVYLVALGAG